MLAKIPTLGPIGYLPAPGTCGAIATIPLMLLARSYTTHLEYFFLCVILFFIAFLMVHKTIKSFGDVQDPSCIVIDELVGCMITFFAIPLSYFSIVIGFLLFRFFDIYKLGLVKKCEELPGAWGIMVDDLLAGILANLVLQMIIPFLF